MEGTGERGKVGRESGAKAVLTTEFCNIYHEGTETTKYKGQPFTNSLLLLFVLQEPSVEISKWVFVSFVSFVPSW
jgi:uncharacterized membrane protein